MEQPGEAIAISPQGGLRHEVDRNRVDGCVDLGAGVGLGNEVDDPAEVLTERMFGTEGLPCVGRGEQGGELHTLGLEELPGVPFRPAEYRNRLPAGHDRVWVAACVDGYATNVAQKGLVLGRREGEGRVPAVGVLAGKGDHPGAVGRDPQLRSSTLRRAKIHQRVLQGEVLPVVVEWAF